MKLAAKLIAFVDRDFEEPAAPGVLLTLAVLPFSFLAFLAAQLPQPWKDAGLGVVFALFVGWAVLWSWRYLVAADREHKRRKELSKSPWYPGWAAAGWKQGRKNLVFLLCWIAIAVCIGVVRHYLLQPR